MALFFTVIHSWSFLQHIYVSGSLKSHGLVAYKDRTFWERKLYSFSLFIQSRTRFFHPLWMKNLIVFEYTGIGKRMSSFLYSSYIHCCEMEAFYYLLYDKRFLLLLTLFLLLFRCTLWSFFPFFCQLLAFCSDKLKFTIVYFE